MGSAHVLLTRGGATAFQRRHDAGMKVCTSTHNGKGAACPDGVFAWGSRRGEKADPLVSGCVRAYLHTRAWNTTFRGTEASIFPSPLSEVVGWILTVPILSPAPGRPHFLIYFKAQRQKQERQLSLVAGRKGLPRETV